MPVGGTTAEAAFEEQKTFNRSKMLKRLKIWNNGFGKCDWMSIAIRWQQGMIVQNMEFCILTTHSNNFKSRTWLILIERVICYNNVWYLLHGNISGPFSPWKFTWSFPILVIKVHPAIKDQNSYSSSLGCVCVCANCPYVCVAIVLWLYAYIFSSSWTMRMLISSPVPP